MFDVTISVLLRIAAEARHAAVLRMPDAVALGTIEVRPAVLLRCLGLRAAVEVGMAIFVHLRVAAEAGHAAVLRMPDAVALGAVEVRPAALLRFRSGRRRGCRGWRARGRRGARAAITPALPAFIFACYASPYALAVLSAGGARVSVALAALVRLGSSPPHASAVHACLELRLTHLDRLGVCEGFESLKCLLFPLKLARGLGFQGFHLLLFLLELNLQRIDVV